MTMIATARAHLAQLVEHIVADLGPAWQVHPTMPSTVTAPAVLILEGSPLLSADAPHTVGEVAVSLELAVLARGQANTDTYPALEAAVDTIATGLLAAGLPLSVDPYAIVTMPDQQTFLGARMQTQITLTFTTQD